MIDGLPSALEVGSGLPPETLNRRSLAHHGSSLPKDTEDFRDAE